MAQVQIDYAEIGISTGKDAPDKLIYDGLMCSLIDFDDDCECVTYDNLEPTEGEFEVVDDAVLDFETELEGMCPLCGEWGDDCLCDYELSDDEDDE